MLISAVMIFATYGIMPDIEVGALSMTYTPSDSYRNSKYYSQLCNVNLTSDQRANLVNVARSQIGYHEGNNSSDLSGSSSGSGNYTEYARMGWFSNPNQWCAYFVSWCAAQAGLSGIIPAFAGCTTGFNTTLPKNGGASTYLRSSGYTPQSGDIIFFNTSAGSPGHVGIVESVSGNYVYTIEGNAGTYTDRVIQTNYSLSNTKIYGYAVPNYSSIKNWYDDYSPVNLGENFCATINNSTTGGYLNNDGWDVRAYPGTNQKDQYWVFNRQNDGSYVITSMLDTNRLTVYNKEDFNCTSVVVTTDDIDIYQKWYIYSSSNGYLFRPAHSNRVMDLDGGGYAAGTNIHIYDYNNTSAQYFDITQVTWYNPMEPTDLGTNFYAFIHNNTTGGYLDNEGWNVGAYPGHGGVTQTFFSKNRTMVVI